MFRQQQNLSRSAFDKGSDLIASAGAVVLTFFAAPKLYHSTISSAVGFAFENYGSDLGGLIHVLWGLLCGAMTFGGCRMLLALTFRLTFARLSGMIFGR